MRIAIIGTGISGLTAAYLLHKNHDIHIFESQKRIGGHTNTVEIEDKETIHHIDTGFIVFNELTYPNFLKLLKQLNVSYEKSCMSFSVKSEITGLEYNGTSINSLFAQKKNIFNLKFHNMVLDILKFNKEAKDYLKQEHNDISLGDFLDQGNYCSTFIDNYLYPMTAAIWSANPQKLYEFPFKFLAQFFENHRMLDISNRPDWQVIRGGSINYLTSLTKKFINRIFTDCPILTIKREQNGVELTSNQFNQIYDHVIIATHSNQALQMIQDLSPLEREILESFPYQKNEAILHTDFSLLPKTKKAWASWNYFLSKKTQSQACVTYHMNRLQNLDFERNYFVSLNAREHIDEDKIIKTIIYEHPVFTQNSYNNQKRHYKISGQDRLHFCGAYWGYGFHEDGVNSALNVCRYFGETLS